MFGVSAKAKAAEAPGVVANWETLNSAYAQETGGGGLPAAIGFTIPTSKWWGYDAPTAITATVITPTILNDFGDCKKDDNVTSTYTVGTDTYAHDKSALTCASYIPNF
jgi:hypothetical protein